MSDKKGFYITTPIFYPNANIDSNWMFVVTDKNLNFGNGGLSTVITVRRVR